ncbi:hypothetical protein [Bernardetia sp. MNP-M8]|uniref:hypothetical protein n=1 Tax=Bernardetia sp. MNP-M8 TaxID=3127470 RepID=UPI0030D010A9
MKKFKLILGAILWIIVIFSSIYLYDFSEQKEDFISIYTRTDSTFLKDILANYDIDKSREKYYWHITKTDNGYFSRRKLDTFSVKNIKSYSVLDSLKENHLITLNSILDNLPNDVDKNSIKQNKVTSIGENTNNPKIKELYEIWLSRIYEKAWIDKMKKYKSYSEGIYLYKLEGDSLGLGLDVANISKIYLKQETEINEDQNKFSITTHYFGRDTLTVKKNYRITTPKGQKIKPFDYEEIK